MATSDVVRARIDSGLKKEASAVLADMGLSVSDAIRLMLVRVASERALPFHVRVPNAKTQTSLRDTLDGKVERFGSVTELMSALNK